MIKDDAEPLNRSGSKTEESHLETTDTNEYVPPTRIVDDTPDRNAERSVLIADGGETIRKFKEIQYTDAEVRSYSADGKLYVYQDGDEYVVVSRGNEPGDTWEKRVPATRTDVTEGESLWAIPDNWELRVKISGSGETKYAIYTIPDTGDDILVSVPTYAHLADADYYVKTVGELGLEFDGTLNQSRLSNRIAELETRDDIAPDLLAGLQAVDEHWDTFESEYLDEFHWGASEAFSRVIPKDETFTLDGWSFDPWVEAFTVTDIITSVVDVDDVAAEVSSVLVESGAIEQYPEVRVTVHSE